MDTLPDNTALVIIDVQEGIDDPSHGRRNNPGAEENMARLLEAWRRTKRPIVHVQHLSTEPDSALRPDRPGVKIKEIMQPREGEPLIQKHVNNAFVGTDLEGRLRSQGVDTVVVIGLTTDHCVSTTARMASDLGFRTYLADDATATHDRTGPDGVFYHAEDIHAANLASLHGEFATVMDTEGILRLVSS